MQHNRNNKKHIKEENSGFVVMYGRNNGNRMLYSSIGKAMLWSIAGLFTILATIGLFTVKKWNKKK